MNKPKDGDELFTILACTWNVTTAATLAKNNETHEIPVKYLTHLAGFIRIDKTYAMTTDLTNPILIAPIGDKDHDTNIMIDGWHRLHRAIQEGIQTLPAKILTIEQSNQSRVR